MPKGLDTWFLVLLICLAFGASAAEAQDDGVGFIQLPASFLESVPEDQVVLVPRSEDILQVTVTVPGGSRAKVRVRNGGLVRVTDPDGNTYGFGIRLNADGQVEVREIGIKKHPSGAGEIFQISDRPTEIIHAGSLWSAESANLVLSEPRVVWSPTTRSDKPIFDGLCCVGCDDWMVCGCGGSGCGGNCCSGGCCGDGGGSIGWAM